MKTLLILIALFICCMGSAQDSLFQNSETPASPYNQQDSPLELGLVFRSSKPGTITHFRFFKAFANDGSEYTLNLYSFTGQKLASQKYSAPGKSGWQRIALSTPVNIDKNVNYVICYNTPLGYFGVRRNFFTQDRIRGNLIAPSGGSVSGNGRFKWGMGFPTENNLNSSYYIDLVFAEEIPRKPLIVDAGLDTAYSLPLPQGVQLNATISGDETRFEWNVMDADVDGGDSLEVIFINSNTLQPIFAAKKEGTYWFTLTGWDKYGTSIADTVQVTIMPDPEEVIMTIQVKRNGTWNLAENKLSPFFQNRFFFLIEKK
jgi:hypothetical protein